VIEYQANLPLPNQAFDDLFADAWEAHAPCDWGALLSHSLGWVCALADGELIGFVNVAWDGGAHAFLLDPTVRTDFRRQGIGTELVRRAAALARERGVEWLHVDYEPHLEGFYARCGFRPTRAGLMRLNCTPP
jgi:GNAT superfamily N-acetyltransferase